MKKSKWERGRGRRGGRERNGRGEEGRREWITWVPEKFTAIVGKLTWKLCGPTFKSATSAEDKIILHNNK